MKPFYKLLFIFLFVQNISIAGNDTLVWLTDFEKAKKTAHSESKHILIYFSGSDWCKPCIKMKKEIFGTDVFRKYAAEHLTCVLADFPRYKKNKLPGPQISHNEKLAEKYNQDGAFPLAVLTDENGDFIAKANYAPGGSEPFLAFLKKYIKPKLETYKMEFRAMGSHFELTAIFQNKAVAENAMSDAKKEIERIEKLISSWDENSQTSAINHHAGERAIRVKKELFDLIKRSKKVSELTDGAFDISFASIDKIWRFDGSMSAMPPEEAIANSVKYIGHEKIILGNMDTSIFLEKKGMKIGFGAIGKGYAANRARDVMKKHGIYNGIVNAGGDLFAWGKQADGKLWKIGIADPKDKGNILAWLELKNTAIVTSGDYERYAMIGGKRYAHIIDPRTGYPATGLKSVSIICPDAELADALATAIFVMSEKEGLELINNMEKVECIMVNEKDEVLTSDNLKLEYP